MSIDTNTNTQKFHAGQSCYALGFGDDMGWRLARVLVTCLPIPTLNIGVDTYWLVLLEGPHVGTEVNRSSLRTVEEHLKICLTH